jgi:hypothetical protein
MKGTLIFLQVSKLILRRRLALGLNFPLTFLLAGDRFDAGSPAAAAAATVRGWVCDETADRRR